jgi:hypothetical protein
MGNKVETVNLGAVQKIRVQMGGKGGYSKMSQWGEGRYWILTPVKYLALYTFDCQLLIKNLMNFKLAC